MFRSGIIEHAALERHVEKIAETLKLPIRVSNQILVTDPYPSFRRNLGQKRFDVRVVAMP